MENSILYGYVVIPEYYWEYSHDVEYIIVD